MERNINYRQHFRRIVAAFLEGTPASTARAHEMLKALPRASRDTLESTIWSPLFPPLSDSVYNEDREYLLQLQRDLAGTSNTIERKYINYDFRPEMTALEQEWCVRLERLLAFIPEVLASIDPHDMEESSDALQPAVTAYEEQTAEIAALVARLPETERALDEPIYRLVLREITAVATNVAIWTSAHRGFPVPEPWYSIAVAHPQVTPDASASLDWANRALKAITGSDWLLITWQFKRGVLLFSLH